MRLNLKKRKIPLSLLSLSPVILQKKKSNLLKNLKVLRENKTEVSETENETETASTNLDGLEDEQMNVKSIMKDYFGK